MVNNAGVVSWHLLADADAQRSVSLWRGYQLEVQKGIKEEHKMHLAKAVGISGIT